MCAGAQRKELQGRFSSPPAAGSSLPGQKPRPASAVRRGRGIPVQNRSCLRENRFDRTGSDPLGGGADCVVTSPRPGSALGQRGERRGGKGLRTRRRLGFAPRGGLRAGGQDLCSGNRRSGHVDWPPSLSPAARLPGSSTGHAGPPLPAPHVGCPQDSRAHFGSRRALESLPKLQPGVPAEAGGQRGPLPSGPRHPPPREPAQRRGAPRVPSPAPGRASPAACPKATAGVAPGQPPASEHFADAAQGTAGALDAHTHRPQPAGRQSPSLLSSFETPLPAAQCAALASRQAAPLALSAARRCRGSPWRPLRGGGREKLQGWVGVFFARRTPKVEVFFGGAGGTQSLTGRRSWPGLSPGESSQRLCT